MIKHIPPSPALQAVPPNPARLNIIKHFLEDTLSWPIDLGTDLCYISIAVSKGRKHRGRRLEFDRGEARPPLVNQVREGCALPRSDVVDRHGSGDAWVAEHVLLCSTRLAS